jgi:hypothetical protein
MATSCAIKHAVERSRPELAESIQRREEIERMTREIATALEETGLQLVKRARRKASLRAGIEPPRGFASNRLLHSSGLSRRRCFVDAIASRQ